MKNINLLLFLTSLLTLIFMSELAYAQVSENQGSQSYQLDNPISVKYLKKNLRKAQPRLVLNQAIEKI